MKVNYSSGNLDVLYTGSVLAYSATSGVELKVELDDSFKFELHFKFESDESSKQNLRSSIQDDTLIFTCVNFDNALGTGTSQPIEIAKWNDRKIYINFWVYTLGQKKAREITYALYSEK